MSAYSDALIVKSDPVQVIELSTMFLDAMNDREDRNASRVCALSLALLVVCEGQDGTQDLELKSEAVIEYIRQIVRERLGKPEPA